MGTRMHRFYLFGLIVGICFFLTLPTIAGASQPEQGKPNIIVILTDDQGWGDLSVHGNTNLKTPHIDSLARDGAIFDRFYVCPVCSPTRAEFLTGRYHPRGGVFSTSTGGERLDLDEITLAEILKSAGYVTAAFGKWHNGMQHPYHPNARGFDEYYGFCSGHWGEYFSPELEHNNNLVKGKGYVTDDFTDHALEFIAKNKDNPFFCYLAYNTPHSPMQVPDRFYKKFAKGELKMRHREAKRENLAHTRAALAMVENIDWNVGRILAKLDDLMLADDTIVIFFSDNGPNGWRWNGGMKGRKGSTDEGGVRVPCLVRWTGHIPPGTKIGQISAAIDLLPTLMDIAGINNAPKNKLDGISLKRLLLGKAKNWPDRMIFSHWRGRVSVRTQQYRLDHQGKLFDMTKDPGQRRDIAKQEKQVAERLRKAVAQWRKSTLPGLRSDRPFTVGYVKDTRLPARDGVPHGNVRRSAGAPNCSFFTNWKTTKDSMTWDIKVAKSGKNQAILYYTCEPKNTGCSVMLSFKDGKVQKKVTNAHNPPLRGKEHDRSSRGSESYVKDFLPLSLGTIELAKGRGLLTLQAAEVKGEGVVDVRRVRLILQK